MSRLNLNQFAIQPSGPRFSRRPPHGYGSQTLTDDQMRLIQEQAIGVFADMTSAGFTFQEALAAVMFTEIHYALEMAKP